MKTTDKKVETIGKNCTIIKSSDRAWKVKLVDVSGFVFWIPKSECTLNVLKPKLNKTYNIKISLWLWNSNKNSKGISLAKQWRTAKDKALESKRKAKRKHVDKDYPSLPVDDEGQTSIPVEIKCPVDKNQLITAIKSSEPFITEGKVYVVEKIDTERSMFCITDDQDNPHLFSYELFAEWFRNSTIEEANNNVDAFADVRPEEVENSEVDKLSIEPDYKSMYEEAEYERQHFRRQNYDLRDERDRLSLRVENLEERLDNKKVELVILWGLFKFKI